MPAEPSSGWAGRATQTQRRVARQDIILADVGITSSTLDRYYTAVTRLAPVLARPCTELELDEAIAEWVQFEFEDGSPLYLVGDALSGLQHFLPCLKRKLTASWRLYSIWRRYEVPARAPPITKDIVLGMMGLALTWGELTMAALLVLAFHCMLRTGEVLQIRPCDFLLGETSGLVTLPSSKSGVRNNSRESVAIHDMITLESVRAMVDLKVSQGMQRVPCWSKSGSAFRGLFSRLLDHLKLTGPD